MKAGANQAHRERVACVHCHPTSVVPYQFGKPAADIHGGVAVVSEGNDSARVLAPGPNEIRDAVNEDTGLAGAGASQNEHVGLLTIVRNYPSLDRIVQTINDSLPRFRRGLAGDLGMSTETASGSRSYLSGQRRSTPWRS